jgi:competence protein ComEC
MSGALLRLGPHAVLSAFCLGLIASLGVAVPRGPAVAGATVAAVLFVAAAHRHSGRAAAVLIVLAGLVGLAWGGARLSSSEPPSLTVPAHVHGTMVVRSPPVADGRGGFRAEAEAHHLEATQGSVDPGARLLVSLPEGAPPPVGARLQVRGRLVAAADRRSPEWWRRYLSRHGIGARLVVRSATVVGRRGGLAGARDAWREWVWAGAATGLSGDRAALVRGMALGGGSGLSEPAATAFRDAGLWHLLAVSGQNVAVVALAMLWGLRALGVPRRVGVSAALVTIVAYCLACDGGASVARAGVVGVLGILAELRSTARERWHLLLVAFALLLAVNPRSIADPGLQLSFSAVIGLLIVAPPVAAWLRGFMPGRVADLVGLAAGAGLATAPILALHFGRLSLVGLVLNVIAVPLAGPVVVVALAAIFAGAVVAPVGSCLAVMAGLGAATLLAMARAAAAVPGGAVNVPAASAVPLLAVPTAVPLVAWWLRRVPPARVMTRAQSHRGWATMRRPAALLAVGALAVSLVGWMGRGERVAPWPDTPAVTALDVGQGDAILLRSPDGAAALIDTGTSRPPVPVLAALRRNGVSRLALVVVTHDQEDHSGALGNLLERHQVGVLVHPPLGVDADKLRADIAAARRRGVEVQEVAAGSELVVGQWRLRVISPDRAPPPGSDPNPYSLTMHAQTGSFDVLLTADAESDAHRGRVLPTVDVLKVAHHGSADAGLGDLLHRVDPATALISVGERNTYGHPTPETLNELRTAGVKTLRTDESGDITVRAGPRQGDPPIIERED